MELSTILYLTLFAALGTLLCYWHFCRGKSAAVAAAPAAAAPQGKSGPRVAAGPDGAAGP